MVTMIDMLQAGVHIGHRTNKRNPKMDDNIFCARDGIHIINLEKTLPKFRHFLKEIERVIEKKRGKVLFVGTKHTARDIIEEQSIRCGMPYATSWRGGTLTNYKTTRKSIKRLKQLEEHLADTKYLQKLTKKEVLTMTREKDKLAVSLDGIKNMGGLPDLIFVIDVNKEKIAVSESNRLGIPVAGIVDTNASPDNLDVVIPGNDDAIRSIDLYCKAVADAVIRAQGRLALASKKSAPAKKSP